MQIILPAEEEILFTDRVTEQVAEQVTEQVAPQVTPQVEKLLQVFEGSHFREELQEKLGLSDRENFRKMYLQPAIEQGLVALTIPDKPTSSKQQYYLTEKGKEVLLNIMNGTFNSQR